MRWCLPTYRGYIIKQWVLNYQVWGRRTTEANNGTWAWNGNTLNELFESHNVARCHFCFNYPSVWLFLPFQTWNRWEPESEISVVCILCKHISGCVCVMVLGRVICWFMECLGLQHSDFLLWGGIPLLLTEVVLSSCGCCGSLNCLAAGEAISILLLSPGIFSFPLAPQM